MMPSGGAVSPRTVCNMTSEDDRFAKHYLSGNTNVSLKAILFILMSIAAFIVLLSLLG